MTVITMYHVVHHFPYEAERLCYFENQVRGAASEADTCDSCNYSGDIRVTAMFRDRGAAQRCSERFAELADKLTVARAYRENCWSGFVEDGVCDLSPAEGIPQGQWDDLWQLVSDTGWRNDELVEDLAALSQGDPMCAAIRLLRGDRRGDKDA